MARRRMVLFDLDLSGRLDVLVRGVDPETSRPAPSVASGLRDLARLRPDPQIPGRISVDRVELVAGGADLELAWQELTATAMATGFALPVIASMAGLLAKVDETREQVVMAPSGMSSLTAGLLSTCDALVVVLPADAEAEVAVRWVMRVLRAGQLEGPELVLPVWSTSAREERTSTEDLRETSARLRALWDDSCAVLGPFRGWPRLSAERPGAARRMWDVLLKVV
jgi:hypothetical protein